MNYGFLKLLDYDVATADIWDICSSTNMHVSVITELVCLQVWIRFLNLLNENIGPRFEDDHTNATKRG